MKISKGLIPIGREVSEVRVLRATHKTDKEFLEEFIQQGYTIIYMEKTK